MRHTTVFPSILLLLALLMGLSSCVHKAATPSLETKLSEIVRDAKGEIGIAVITPDGDTVTVNNDSIRYPLMSVFKLHQTIALCRVLDERGVSLDTVVPIRHDELNPDTWSPLLQDNPEGDITLPMTELLDYLLLYSDNNVSNILFDRFCPVAETDSIVRSFAPDIDFALRYTEHEMQLDHEKAYSNWSSPLACAALIDYIFTDSVVSSPKQQFLISALQRCETGRERISAPFAGNDSVMIAHRTGSGYVNDRGVVAAVNDVAHITLPDGRSYSIAILVKDFDGTQESAEKLMARISAAVYDAGRR